MSFNLIAFIYVTLAIIALFYFQNSFKALITEVNSNIALNTADVEEENSTMKNLRGEVVSAPKIRNEAENVTVSISRTELPAAISLNENQTFLDEKNVKIMLESPEKYQKDFRDLAVQLNCTRKNLPRAIASKFRLPTSSTSKLRKYNYQAKEKFYSKYNPKSGYIFYPKNRFSTLDLFSAFISTTKAFEKFEDLN